MDDRTARHDTARQTRIALSVFAALAAFTLATVGAGVLHLPIAAAVLLALAIALVKGGLVAAYFMHLRSEVKVVYWIAGLALFLLLALIFLTLVSVMDGVHA